MFVNRVAQLESGDRLFIFEGGHYIITEGSVQPVLGEIEELPEGLRLQDDARIMPEVYWKVGGPEPTDQDHLYLVTKEKAYQLTAFGLVKAATHVGPDRVLISTEQEVHDVDPDDVLWGGRVENYEGV